MDQFLKTTKQFFESDKKKNSKPFEMDMDKKRILMVKKTFLPFWMRKFPKDTEVLDRKNIQNLR